MSRRAHSSAMILKACNESIARPSSSCRLRFSGVSFGQSDRPTTKWGAPAPSRSGVSSGCLPQGKERGPAVFEADPRESGLGGGAIQPNDQEKIMGMRLIQGKGRGRPCRFQYLQRFIGLERISKFQGATHDSSCCRGDGKTLYKYSYCLMLTVFGALVGSGCGKSAIVSFPHGISGEEARSYKTSLPIGRLLDRNVEKTHYWWLQREFSGWWECGRT